MLHFSSMRVWLLGLVVLRLNNAIHWIVIFSTVLNMPEKQLDYRYEDNSSETEPPVQENYGWIQVIKNDGQFYSDWKNRYL